MTLERIRIPIHKNLCQVEEELKRRTNHTIDVFGGGKRLRPMLLLYAANAFEGVQVQDVARAASAIEMIHTASLVHDDIIDDSVQRRNKPTLYRSVGTKSAVIFADFLFAQGLAMLASVEDSNVISLTVRAVETMCEGQWKELAMQAHNDYTEQDYLDVIEKKTVSLFDCCCRIGGMFRNAEERELKHLGDFGRYFGFVYQLLDDAADLSTDRCSPAEQRINEWGGKKYCEQLAREFTEKARTAISHISNGIERKGFEQILSFIMEVRS